MDDSRPIFLQIAELIENSIIDGTLGEDAQVPSTNELAAFHRINPATAAKGFAQLVDEGVLYKRRGVGMFVAPGARERLLADARESFFTDTVDPVADAARVLGIDVEDVVARLRARTATRTTDGGTR